ncbi:MAG: RHS repeat-associated core domain-containing protein [Acidobacteriota bacterium]
MVVTLAALAGSLYGGRLFLLQPSQTPPSALKGGPPQSVQIMSAAWVPLWFSESTTFTAEVVARAPHGMFVVHGTLRITDGAGNLVRSWAEIKKVKTDTGEETLVFSWTFDGRDGLGQPVPDGAYGAAFEVQFRGQRATWSGVVGLDRLPPTVAIDQPEEGQLTGASVEVRATWADPLSGIDPTTGSVTLDGAPVNGLQIDASGTRGTIEDIAGGQHTLVVSVADYAGNAVSASREFVTDRTPPAITIQQPRGQINGPSVPVEVVWSDDGGAGIDSSSGEISLDGSPTSGLTIDEQGARGTLDVSPGAHSLSASVSDEVGNEASAMSDFEVTSGQPGVQNTSIVGTVADSTGASLSGVEVSSPGASQSVTTDADGRFLIEMTSGGGTHWLTFEKEGYIPVQRPATVPEGQHFHLGQVHMVAEDSNVTTIGPGGGTATDSSGDVELVVPPGALSEPVDIRLTHIPTSKELPGPLNASENVQFPISYTFCVYLEPYGTAFSQATTLRYPNRWGFAAGHRVPTAFWDESASKWIPDGGQMIVSQNGATIEKQISAFSLPGQRRALQRTASGIEQQQVPQTQKGVGLDGNHSPTDDGSTPQTAPDTQDPPCKTAPTPSRSSMRIFDSSFSKSFALPAMSEGGANVALSFQYHSATALPGRFVNILNSFGTNAGQMVDWSYSIEVNGSRKDLVFSPPSGPSRLLYFWDGRNGRGDLSPTALYQYTSSICARYPGYFANQAAWGGTPTGVTSGRMDEPAERRITLEQPISLVNSATSPYGAGWDLAGLRRLHLQPDGKVMMVEGGSATGIYWPRLNFALISEGASIADVRSVGSEGDPRNMLGYHGAGARTEGQLSDLEYQDAFEFGAIAGSERDWVVVDLGQERLVHTLGISFMVPDISDGLVTEPLVRIYTSLDNVNWTSRSNAYYQTLNGTTAVRLSSPYLARSSAPENVRYVRFEIESPMAFGIDSHSFIYRLFAFGDSERYGTGPYGQDEQYPRLRRLQQGEFEQTERDGTVWLYSADGFLRSVTDIHGNATVYGWTDGLLTQITHPAGGITALNYDGGKLVSVTDPAGRVTRFTVSGQGDLASVQMPDDSTVQFAYDARHLLSSVTDPRGQATTYTWNESYPRLEKIRAPTGGEIIYHSGYFDHLINLTEGTEHAPAPAPSIQLESTANDELGRTYSYKWEAYESVYPYKRIYARTVVDPAGRQTVRYMHPRMEDVESLRVDPDGSRIRNTRDPDEGLYVVKVEDMSETVLRTKAEFTYEPTFKRLASSTDLGGHTTTYLYNQKGDLISTTDPAGHVTQMTYDSNGMLLTVTDAENAVTRYEYDARGNRIKVIDPLGRETVMTYDIAGNMTSLTDPEGHVTRWEYDSVGRVTKVIDPAGGETRYAYEPAGCASGCGGSGGLLTSITDPSGRTTTFEYDSDARMTAVVNPLGVRKEYTYDLGGRLIKFKNGRGQEILYQYDASNNLVKRTLPEEGDVDYTYDIDDRVTSVADADSILRYGYAPYTGFQNVLPGHQATGLKGMKMYEMAGVKGDPRYQNQMSAYQIYNYNTYVGGVNTYELLGQIRMFVDMPDGTTKEISQSFDSYDLGHRLAHMWASGVEVTLSYDRVGRRTRMTARPYHWGSSLSTDYDYDAGGQLLSLQNLGPLGGTGGIWQTDFAYSYDAAGNRTSMTDPAGTHSFGYDDRYQLTSATHPTIPPEAFGYDPVGNRTTSHISPSYTYNSANQLLDDAEFSYTYDLDGNCVRKVSKLDGTRHEYIFNSENRMTGYRKYDISSNLITSANYYYDPAGRRIAKEVNGQRRRYVYQEEDVWLVEREDVPQYYWVNVHAPGIDDPLFFYLQYLPSWDWGPPFGGGGRGLWTYYLVKDGLGTVRELRNYWTGSGQVTTALTYDSFGQILSPTNPTDQTYAFTGREFDAESNSFFLRARSYEPRTGRFTAEDPLGHIPRVPLTSFYAYSLNRPVTFADPLGWTAINWGDGSCPGKVRGIIETAAGLAHAAAVLCLPKRLKDKTVPAAGGTVTIECYNVLDPPGCAGQVGSQINLRKRAISSSGGCGCLASVLFHEFMHIGEADDGGERIPCACELLCFPECAVVGAKCAGEPIPTACECE